MPPQPHEAEPTARGRFRKEALILLMFILLPAIGFFALRTQRSNLAGVYLIAGGQGYMHLVDTPTGTQVEHFKWMHYSGNFRLRTLRGARLIADIPGHWTGGPLVIHMAKSSSRPGDFDLVMVDQLPSSTSPWSKALTWALEMWNWKRPASGAPIPNFFHRITDPDALQYMQLAARDPSGALAGHSSAPATTATLFAPSPQSTQLLHLSQAMLTRAPDDLYLRLLRLDALLRAARADELQRQLALWKPDFDRAKLTDPIPHAMATLVERKAHGLLAAQSGRNAHGLLLEALARDTNREEGLSAIRGMLDRDALSTPGGVTQNTDHVMNFLETQTRVKLACTQALLDLFSGQVDRALATALGAYRMGQLLQLHDDFLITKLIAVALRAISVRTLLAIVANAPLTNDQLVALGEQLSRLQAGEKLAATENLTDSSLPFPIPTGGGFPVANYHEAATRHDVSYAKFGLLHAIAAARHTLSTTGKLPDPGAGTSLPPLLPAGPGLDPFSPTSGPLKLLLNTTSNTLLAYSVGPDTRDDLGAIEYDPTNGTVSPGDITAELRATPQYPFPAGGVRAETTAALMAQFPEGLPFDLFYGTSTRSDRLLDAESTGGVVVYSIGPDRKEEDYTAGTAVMYDPTNGTVSGGDLMTTLSR